MKEICIAKSGLKNELKEKFRQTFINDYKAYYSDEDEVDDLKDALENLDDYCLNDAFRIKQVATEQDIEVSCGYYYE